jgi:DNA-binding NarL/FixJ family response regulator
MNLLVVEQLTPREHDVARRLTRGLTNREIAAELGISAQTVKRHLASAYGKLQLSGRVALALHMAFAPERDATLILEDVRS